MNQINEEKLKKLDEMSLAWLLEQISVGKVVRGYYRLVGALKPVADNVRHFCQCEKMPEGQEEKKEEKKPEGQS